MDSGRRMQRMLWIVCLTVLLNGGLWAQATAPATQEGFQPQVGQAGKDVVWVPTPYVLVEKMLDMAKVGPQDLVMDLGSGDGRNIIAAAKRGARAIGVEYNPNMVDLSRKTAAKEGVSDKATFIEGDMFEADISKATVLALFLLPDNLRRLTPKFLDLKPGTRIVGNTFGIEGWAPDETDTSGGDCGSWCQSLLWIVPAKVAGTWRLPKGELALSQSFQVIAGTLTVGGTATPIVNGKLRGDQISFSAAGTEYAGRVEGDSISGTMKSGSNSGSWNATRTSK